MKLSEKGIIIRKSIEDDLPQIYSLWISESPMNNLSYRFTPENIADIFASDNSVYFSAVRKKKVLGFVIGSVQNSDARIHWMLVKHNFRNSGIGSELLNRFIEISEKKCAAKFLTAVLENNKESEIFFANRDFTVKETMVELCRKSRT